MTHKAALLLILLLATVYGMSRVPKPYCSNKLPLKQLPLTIDEKAIHDMADAFGGYNLEITLPSNNSFATLQPKWVVEDSRDHYFPNIISHYVEGKDNSVGRDSFILFKEPTGAIMLSYGVIDPVRKDKLPQINSSVLVTSDKDVVCFDAALFLQHGIAMVDCAKKSSAFFSTHDNVFYVVDLTTHTVKKTIQNDLFIPYSSITRRSTLKFSHPQAGGFTYLLRTHFSDSVDEGNADNTYMEIFLAPVDDPTDLQLISVIDRSWLLQRALRIMDVDVYNGDIYLLDYDTGLYRLDILNSQRVMIKGRYRGEGFRRFGVYSDDLEDELIIALANQHSVVEVDWHIMWKPVQITRYSLMENSDVKQVMLNDQYMIVQSTAKGTNADMAEVEIDYTWVFGKLTRSYLNAYHIISHNSSMVQLAFDRENSRFYIADEKGLTLNRVGPASLELSFKESSMIGQEQEVALQATSFDPHYKQPLTCQVKWKVEFISRQNTTIFPSGMLPPKTYSVNYPKPIQALIDGYFLGPNLHYKVQTDGGLLIPDSWLNKVNRTTINLENPDPTVRDVVFLHSDVVENFGKDTILYYFQDASNNTHLASCIHNPLSKEVDCDLTAKYEHKSQIRAFVSPYFDDNDGHMYFYCFVFDMQPKDLHIYNYYTGKQVAQIIYEGGLEAEINHISSSNGFLYVLRKLAKTIDVYNLVKCQEYSTCRPDFSITQATMKGLGVSYFTPEKVITDAWHPEVMFIQCLGSLIILDVDNKEKLHLMDQIISPVTLSRHYSVATSKNRMVLVSDPDLIEEYSLEHLYIFNTTYLTKNLPTYGMRIQPNADLAFSDFDSTVYINAIDPNRNVSVVLIYRTDHVSLNSLYSVIHLDKLYSRPGFEIEASGFFTNYVTINLHGQFRLYRVYGQPFITIHEAAVNFKFELLVSNDNHNFTTPAINVTVINQPQNIHPTEYFEEAKKNLGVSNHGDFEWEDREWFEGSVVHYNYSCPDCHKGQDTKVRLRQHIDRMKDAQVGGNFYTESYWGGVSVYDDLFFYRPNGSIYHVVNLPDQKLNEKCERVASAENEYFAVTACRSGGIGINLYVTSMISFKGFTWGPYKSEAFLLSKMQIMNDILVLVDTSAYPQEQHYSGSIYLYRLSFNTESEQEMDQLDVIDEGTLMGTDGWDQEDAYLANAHMVYSDVNKCYRLYITEARYGVFIIDFVKNTAQTDQITIISRRFVNLRSLLESHDLHMPTEGAFLAVTYVKSMPSPHFDIEDIVVTTHGYHQLQVQMVFNEQGTFQNAILGRIYKRYSFYNALNEVHASKGFLLVGYKLPGDMQAHREYPNQYVALYDTNDYPHESHKGYSEHSMVGAVPFEEMQAATFAINTTHDTETDGSRAGLVVHLPSNHRMVTASIAHNMTFSLTKGYHSQEVKLNAYNDFSEHHFTVSLIAHNEDEDEQSTLKLIIIIACSVVFVIFVAYIAYVARRRYKKKEQQGEQRDTLITEEEAAIRQSQANEGGSGYTPPEPSSERVQEAPVMKSEPVADEAQAGQAAQQEEQSQEEEQEEEEEEEEEEAAEREKPSEGEVKTDSKQAQA